MISHAPTVYAATVSTQWPPAAGMPLRVMRHGFLPFEPGRTPGRARLRMPGEAYFVRRAGQRRNIVQAIAKEYEPSS